MNQDDRNLPNDSSRRGFLKGEALLKSVQDRASAAFDAASKNPDAVVPEGGDTVRLSQRAMACDFSVILNPGDRDAIESASTTLELLPDLEQQMSVYRPSSELSRINSAAAEQPVPATKELFELLRHACELSRETNGAFDPTSGPQVRLWRTCRDEKRLPTDEEIAATLEITGEHLVEFHNDNHSIGYKKSGVEMNLGGIGKGYALDRCGEFLANSVDDFLLHGGRSSLLARGEHNGTGGWPVGIGNPLLTDKRLGTLLLQDKALSTSGSNIQHFRLAGRRFGHILDPRTGWPVEGMLSVTVVADSAAAADALSTAFFVLGLENARGWCDNHPEIGAILIPYPESGRRVQPVVLNMNSDNLFWDATQVQLTRD